MWIGTTEVTWKRVAIGIGVLAALVFVVWILWRLFRGAPTPPPTPPSGPSTGIGLPTSPPRRPRAPGAVVEIPTPGALPGFPTAPTIIAEGGPTQITSLTTEPVTHLTLAGDGRAPIAYNPNEGLFYRITPDGTATPLSDRIFRDVKKVAWAPGSAKAVLEFPDGANIVYDFTRDEQVTLPKEWTDFSFNPSGNSLAFKSLGDTEEDRWLAIANADGSEARRIAHLGNRDHRVIVAWSPNNQVVALYPDPQQGNQQEVVFLGKNQENFLSLPVAGRGFRAAWSPDGENLLYSVYKIGNGSRPQLALASAVGESIGETNIALGIETWPEKCAFANTKELICAVPHELPDGAGLFPEVAKDIPDTIVHVDLASGVKTVLAEPELPTTVDRMTVSEDGRYLFYTNKQTGILERIQLKE